MFLLKKPIYLLIFIILIVIIITVYKNIKKEHYMIIEKAQNSMIDYITFYPYKIWSKLYDTYFNNNLLTDYNYQYPDSYYSKELIQ